MIIIKSLSLRTIIPRELRKLDLSIYAQPTSSFCKSRFYHRNVNENVENRLKAKDSIGQDFHIIYRAPLLNYVKVTYGVTFLTSICVPPMLGKGILDHGIGNYPVYLWDTEFLHSSLELWGIIGAILLVIGQVSYTVFKYPFRIYYSPSSGKYVAIYQHIFPWKISKEEFYAGEMKKIEKSYSLWHDSLYQVKNRRKAILLEDHFLLPKDFNDMLAIRGKEVK